MNHNMNAINAHRNMTNNTNASGKSMEKLSSGLRINRAGDDAAGLSISEKMRGQIRGLDQAARNSQDGISYIQTAEGALTEVSAMLTRMKELAVQKANGTNNTQDTANIDLEMNTLKDEVKNITDNTKFNGKNVFTSTNVAITVTQDAAGLLNIGAATLTKTIALGSGSTVGQIEAAIDEVNLQRATYGSQQNRLEHTINNLNTTSENLTAAESRIRDVDMAKEMMNFSKNNILQQAAQAMISQANQQPQGVLQLLR
ncbi:flagellin [Clostridium perfringens]|uniref:flagellin N-terminal helical domain-containing protein n=1 Tax=Clostridium perfringens TaxID=1502 RepID=UPI002ACC09E4|nr:flagellin [Clostridium perfringens]